jgi:hypothetical protein
VLSTHRVRPALAVAALAVVAALPIPLGSRDAAAFDITRYDITVEPDFEAGVLSLTADVAIDNPALEREFTFALADFYGSIEMESKYSSGTWEQTAPGWIKVTLGSATETVALHFKLSGKPGRSADENREILSKDSLFLLWSDRFYPMSFDDWAVLHTKVVVPDTFKAVAPGRLVSNRASGNKRIYVFETMNPAVCCSVFADARWIETEKTLRGIRMRTLLYPESQRFAEQIFETSGDVLSFYSKIYCPYPFDEFAFVTLSGIFARRAFPGFVGYSPAYLEREFSTTGHDAHETALLWWFYTTRGRGLGSFQWTEGFGDYAELLYDEARGKPHPRIFETFREKYLALPASEEVPYSALTGSTAPEIVHGKYPWIMRALHGMVGDEPFRKGMRLLFKRFRFKTFSMDEFVSTLEDGTGRSLAVWREEWLERPGVPAVSMTSNVERSPRGYLITVRLEQSGELYHLPLEIGIKMPRGMRVERVALDEPRKVVTFETPHAPLEVVLDPNGWFLMKRLGSD